MTKLAVLRLENMSRLVVKEPESPVVLTVLLCDELVPEQVRHLCVASLFNPVMVEADILEWDGAAQAFRARLTNIEILPKISAPKCGRKARAGLAKRKRGGGSIELE
jgi:hypothetical protein